ncbi:MAG: putative nucleic acid-binding Zn-ribbon protein, partial [Lysobacterales bacterium]
MEFTMILRLLLLLLIVLSTTIVHADSQRNIIQSFRVHSDELHQKGDVVGAIDDISRALLIDPFNKQLQQILQSFKEEKNIPGNYRIYLYQFEDLISLIYTLEDQITTYKSSGIKLREDLLRLGVSPKNLEHEMSRIINVNALSNRHYVDSSEGNFLPINELNKMLIDEKNNLISTKNNLATKYDRLQNLKKDILAKVNNEPKSLVAYNHPQRFYAQDGERVFRKNTIAIVQSRKNEVENLALVELMRVEVEKAQNKFDEISNLVNAKEKRIESLENQIIDISLRLQENKNRLEFKDGNISQKHKEIDELSSRLELSQKLIKSKNDEITKLSDQLLDTSNKKLDSKKIVLRKEPRFSHKENVVMNDSKDRLATLPIKEKSLYNLKYAKLKEKFNTQGNEIVSLRKDIKFLKKDKLEEKKEFAKLEKNIQNLRSELFKQTVSQKKHVQEIVKKTRSKNSQLKQGIALKNSKIKSIITELDKKDKLLGEIKDEFISFKKLFLKEQNVVSNKSKQ